MTTSVETPRRRGLFYGWYIAIAGATNNALILGVTVFGFGVFIEPVRKDLGWSLAALTIGFSIRSFQSGLLAPFVGLLLEWIGPRRMSIVGVFVVAGGLLFMAQMHALWEFYVSSMVVALGQSMGGVTPFSTTIVRWFRRSRGRAMGVLFSGNALGYGMAPVMAFFIVHYGWRVALVVAASAIVLVGTPLAFVIRPRPEDHGLLPDGDLAPSEAAAPGTALEESGMTVAETVRTPAFYLLMLAMTVGAPTQSALIVFQVPVLEHAGYSAGVAALLAAGYGLVQAPVRLVVGGIADRIGRRRAYAWCFLLQAAGLVVFASMDSSRVWLVPLFYGTYALGHALFTTLFLTTVADYFGTRRFASLQGIIQFAGMPVGLALPIVTGVVFDRTGTYSTIFLVYAALASLGAVFVFLIRRPTWHEFSSALTAAPPATAAAAAAGD
ncbi:MAG TPA: MFS transporter [Dehalococcoidia bacterium]|nr:MFS transporter [Dehalococcoidia bacterium]